MLEEQYVIIGAVAAGTKAAARLRRLDANAKISLIDKSSIISYGGCAMPYFIEGKFDDFQMLWGGRDKRFFEEKHKLDVYTETQALKIDRAQRKVELRDLKTGKNFSLDYSKLILAVGAEAVKLGIAGEDLKNVFQLKHPKQALGIKEAVAKEDLRHAVVVGGGLIGLETASALKSLGLQVSILEASSKLLGKQMSEEMSLKLIEHLQKNGVNVELNTSLRAFKGDDNGRLKYCVSSAGGFEADLAVTAIGMRPNTALAKAAGLELSSTGAILTNEHLQTSDENIYAGGDCIDCVNAAVGKRIYSPLGDLANIHGRLIADNICGLNRKYPGTAGTWIMQVLGMNAGGTGVSEDFAQRNGFDTLSVTVKLHDKPVFFENSEDVEIKLCAERGSGKILGMEAVGKGEIAKALNSLAVGLYYGIDVNMLSNMDFAYAPPFAPPLDNLISAANVLGSKEEKLSKEFDASFVASKAVKRLQDELFK